jgi:hypothetical protein
VSVRFLRPARGASSQPFAASSRFVVNIIDQQGARSATNPTPRIATAAIERHPAKSPPLTGSRWRILRDRYAAMGAVQAAAPLGSRRYRATDAWLGAAHMNVSARARLMDHVGFAGSVAGDLAAGEAEMGDAAWSADGFDIEALFEFLESVP